MHEPEHEPDRREALAILRPRDGARRRMSTGAAPEIDNPHELLGLPADEEDCERIIAAARVRLARIRAGNGSEFAVRRVVMQQIEAARDAMLLTGRPGRVAATTGSGCN